MSGMITRTPTPSWVMIAWLLPLSFAHPAHGQTTQALDKTGRSAAFLLQSCTTIHRSGLHHRLLAAIRQLRDPEIKPLFHRLVQSPHPALVVHGLLGLAECSPNQKLDLAQVAAIGDPVIQAQVISAAMDSELMTHEQAKQLIRWPNIDPAAKLVVAAQLVQDQQFSDFELLENAVRSDNAARKGLAAMLMLQMGRSQAMPVLDQLAVDPPNATGHDHVRLMLLETAMRYELDQTAPWAARLITERGVSRTLRLLAMRVAMRFGVPNAIGAWQDQFASTTDQAQRTRLALLALGLSPWLDPGLFMQLTADPDPLVQRIGQTGHAIASNRQIHTAVIRLIEMHHVIANRWALKYAQQHAADHDAQVILLGLIMAFENHPPRQKAQALLEVVLATQELYDRYPQVATSLLQPILADPRADSLLTQGILQGLLRCAKPNPDRVVLDLDAIGDPQAHRLAILLLAKHGRGLSPQQNEELKMLVRGGGGLGQSLRLQAAWVYLKQTNQSHLALASTTGP